ncbi:MAG TPA: hypothetical protein PKD74_02955, partial [Candidatus Dependentiae bacterium]|nr:hypothetical protein [Candidatus Dependentiae bacterium]
RTPALSIKPKDLVLNAQCTDTSSIHACYKAAISHDKNEQQEIIKGTVKANKKSLHINGTFNTFSYTISASFDPYIR